MLSFDDTGYPLHVLGEESLGFVRKTTIEKDIVDAVCAVRGSSITIILKCKNCTQSRVYIIEIHEGITRDL